jgi:DNA topoisomerase-1
MIVYRNHQADTVPDEKKYVYTDNKDGLVTDVKVLEQIKKMSIPPAYTKVIIDLSECAKIIYEGYDDKNRLQQIYSKAHNTKAKKTKFCRLIEFGKVIPKLKGDIKKIIGSKKITQNKIIALILKIIWICGFRLGNQKYMFLYESYGISNIRKSHMIFKEGYIYIEFKGKKSVINQCFIKDKELVLQLKDLVAAKQPKDHIFTYSKDNVDTLIKPTEINNFLKTYGNITSKDLRTFDVNTLFIDFMKGNLKDLMEATSLSKRKKIAKQALELTSAHINNTVAICKSSYLLTDIYDLAVEEPKKFKRRFGGKVESRIQFINFLNEVYCK